jgi:hypothetical protein
MTRVKAFNIISSIDIFVVFNIIIILLSFFRCCYFRRYHFLYYNIITFTFLYTY